MDSVPNVGDRLWDSVQQIDEVEGRLAISLRLGYKVSQGLYRRLQPSGFYGMRQWGGNCVRTNHAEANAIAFCAREGINTKGATAYVTCEPCRTCGSLLRTAGIAEVIWFEQYRDQATSP